MLGMQLKLPARHTVTAFFDGHSETGFTRRVALVNLLDNVVTPWCTYRVDDEGHCTLGHYESDPAEALRDFLHRAFEVDARTRVLA